MLLPGTAGDPVVFEDSDHRRRGRLLLSILIPCYVLGMAIITVQIISAGTMGHSGPYAIGLTVWAAITFWLAKKDHVTTASILFIGGFWALTAVTAYFFGGLRNPGNTVLTVLVLMAALIVGIRAGVITAAVSIATMVTIYLLDLQGLLPVIDGPIQGTPTSYLLNIVFALVLTVVPVTLAMRGLDEARRKLQAEVRVRRAAEEKTAALARKLIRAQEDERAAISRELHDEAGQVLAALKMNLQSMKRRVPTVDSTFVEQIDDAMDHADRTAESLRSLAYGLRPPVLEDSGLNSSLNDMCLTVANLYPMEVTYSGQDLTELPPVHQVTLYRLVQEALNNAARHAKAAKARVKVSLTERQVLLTVEDNGEGFEVEPAMNIQRAGSGLGLIGMQERVGLIGGRLTIESSAGTGTTVTAEIPLC